jgi:hypothetical protein
MDTQSITFSPSDIAPAPHAVQSAKPAPTQNGPITFSPSDIDTTAPAQTAETQTSQPSTAQPGAISRFVSGAYHEVADPIAAIFHGAGDQPRDATEHIIAGVGGPGALPAYRAAKTLIDQVQQTLKAKPEAFQQAKQDLVQAVSDFHDKKYQNALGSGVSLLGDLATLNPSNPSGVGERVQSLGQGMREGGDLATPLGQTAADIGMASLDSEAASNLKASALQKGAQAVNAVTKPFQAPELAPTLRNLAGVPEAGGDFAAGKAPAFNRAIEVAAPDIAEIADSTRFTKTGNARVGEFVDALRQKAAEIPDEGGTAQEILPRIGALTHIADSIESRLNNSEFGDVKRLGLKGYGQRIVAGALGGSPIPHVGSVLGAVLGAGEAGWEDFSNVHNAPGAKLDRMLQGLRDNLDIQPEDINTFDDQKPVHPFNPSPEQRPNVGDFTPEQLKTLLNVIRERQAQPVSEAPPTHFFNPTTKKIEGIKNAIEAKKFLPKASRFIDNSLHLIR